MLAIIIFMAGYSITPFWHNCGNTVSPNPDSTHVAIPGTPDTTYHPGETHQGIIRDTVYVAKEFNPGSFETTLDTTLKQGTQVNVRHTTWYWPEQEGIGFAKSLEWNIKERPCSEIVRVDTVEITYPAPNKETFWDNRFIPYLGGGIIYNPVTKTGDWGIQLGFGIRLN